MDANANASSSGAPAGQPSHPRDLTSTTPAPAEPSWSRAPASGRDEARPEVRHDERGQASPSPSPSSLSQPLPTSSLSLSQPLPTSSSPSSTGPIAAGLFLAALAAAALVLARRRKRVPRLVEIVETASLGPKRSLVVARMGDELLLLGASEGGITLLTTRAAPAAVHPLCDPLPPPVPLSRPEPAPSAQGAGLLSRFKLRPPPRSAPAFEALLAESVEDVELRRKLAGGQAGSVR